MPAKILQARYTLSKAINPKNPKYCVLNFSYNVPHLNF